MKPKYLKQARKTTKEKQRTDPEEVERLTHYQDNPEPLKRDSYHECGMFSRNYSDIKLKQENTRPYTENRQKDDPKQSKTQKQNSNTTSERKHKQKNIAMNSDEKQEDIIFLSHSVTDKMVEKCNMKKQQEEENFNIMNDNKICYQIDNSLEEKVKNCTERTDGTTTSKETKTKHRVDNRSNGNVKTKAKLHLSACDMFSSSNFERHSSLITDVSDSFCIDDFEMQTAKNCQDQKSEDLTLSTKRRAPEGNEELVHKMMSRTSSTDYQNELIDNIYRTLIRVKGQNLSLQDLSDVMAKHARIHIDDTNREDLLVLLEQNEKKFVIVYRTDEPLLSVKTEVTICPIFTNDPRKQHKCGDLHICKYFLLSKCHRKDCKFGHNLSSGHNKNVFRNYGLDEIEKGSQMSLIRNVESRNASTMPLICKFYNNVGGCKHQTKCTHLHVCKNFINDDCKFGKKCNRCHNILSKQPLSVLERYGLMPESYNYKKIISLLKDTLSHGEVLLKRYIQTKRREETSRQQRNKTERERLEAVSSQKDYNDESDLSEGSYSYDEIDDRSISELSTQSEEYGDEENDSDSEYLDDDIGTTDTALKTSHTLPSEVVEKHSNCHCDDGSRNKERDDFSVDQPGAIKSVMTFESQLTKTQFMVRTVNGKWEISNKYGNWRYLDADESGRLTHLHDDFVKFAEKIVSDAQD